MTLILAGIIFVSAGFITWVMKLREKGQRSKLLQLMGQIFGPTASEAVARKRLALQAERSKKLLRQIREHKSSLKHKIDMGGSPAATLWSPGVLEILVKEALDGQSRSDELCQTIAALSNEVSDLKREVAVVGIKKVPPTDLDLDPS